jgi:hypothetical protein
LTEDQVLFGLEQFWVRHLGCDSPFEPGARLGRTEWLFDEADLADHLDALGDFFGLSCPPQEWAEFLGLAVTDPREWEENVAPRLTFRGLAAFIAARVETIPLEPVSLLGQPCLTAGIFGGLEQLVAQVHRRARHFGPSTPIRRRLRGPRLRLFCERLHWIGQGRLPAPPRLTITRRALDHYFWGKAAAAILTAVLVGDWSVLCTGFLVGLLLLIPLAAVVTFLNEWWIDPLPAGARSFGDLARLLAEASAGLQQRYA